MLEQIATFQEQLSQLTFQNQTKIKAENFYLLLDLVPSLVAKHNTDCLEVCDTKNHAPVKELLSRMGITDAKSLEESIDYNYHCGDQYAQFLTFWEGNPCFDESELKPEGHAYFTFCKEYAEQFHPYVKEFGFYAWDISESIHRIREGFTCGYITEAQAHQKIQTYVDLVRRYFYNFKDYAMSYVCGSMYYMMRESRSNDHVEMMQKRMLHVCRTLLLEPGTHTWATTSWLAESIYFKELYEVKNLHLEHGTLGCFVTDRVSVEGEPIGYFYHDEGMEQFPDSGWRFFAGDEDKTYLENPEHTHIFSLNTIANVFPNILPCLSAPVGSAFERKEDGTFQPVDMEKSDHE